MLSPKYRKLIFDLLIRIRSDRVKKEKLEQLVEIFGDDNRLFAAEEFNRPVNEKEAIDHYSRFGGREGYRQRIQEKLHRRRSA